MDYWSGLDVVDLLVICALLLVARVLAARVPGYRKLALPPAILAGMLGLALGDSGLGLVHIGAHTLEAIVYHGLAIVFIAMTLQTSAAGKGGQGARSVAFAIPFLTCVQAILGLLLVLGWTAMVVPLHPGVGMMLPLGFSQGPGQALSLGSAWEHMGMESGSQIGLTVATAGYAVCIGLGLVYFHAARHLGWVDSEADHAAGEARTAPAAPDGETGFGLEPLMGQLALVGAIYLAVYGTLVGTAHALAGKPQLAAMIWGFHFLVSIILALVVRTFNRVARVRGATDDPLLSRIAGVAVDLGSAAAIAAIQFSEVRAFLGPILALVVPGALVTLAASIWLGRRAFPESPFSHSLVLFGTLTGTLPTGLTLLRLDDPELRGPAARSMVAGAALAIIPGAPLLLKLLPMPVFGWPESFPGAVWRTLGLITAYTVLLAVLWRVLGPLRSVGSPLRLWPRDEPHPLAPPAGPRPD